MSPPTPAEETTSAPNNKSKKDTKITNTPLNSTAPNNFTPRYRRHTMTSRGRSISLPTPPAAATPTSLLTPSPNTSPLNPHAPSFIPLSSSPPNAHSFAPPSGSTLSVLQINARSLHPKLSELANVVSQTQPDIVAVTETWLTLCLTERFFFMAMDLSSASIVGPVSKRPTLERANSVEAAFFY